jgi:putative hydrolase of the HAD superfamily
LKEGYDNIILSNHTPELFLLAEELKIAKYFKEIVTSAYVGYEKPNPAFYKVIESFGRYDEYYMIGDNYIADIQGALDYGINAVLVRSENEQNYPYYSKNLDGIWEFIK